MSWVRGCVFGVGEFIMASNPLEWYREAPPGSEIRIGICSGCHGPVWRLRRGHIGLYLKPIRDRLRFRFIAYCDCMVVDVNNRRLRDYSSDRCFPKRRR